MKSCKIFQGWDNYLSRSWDENTDQQDYYDHLHELELIVEEADTQRQKAIELNVGVVEAEEEYLEARKNLNIFLYPEDQF